MICTGGKGKTGITTDFAVDSVKLAISPYNGKLGQVNLITKLAGFTDILYSYKNRRRQSRIPSYRGRAMALRYYGTVYDAVVLGFPMYFVVEVGCQERWPKRFCRTSMLIEECVMVKRLVLARRTLVVALVALLVLAAGAALAGDTGKIAGTVRDKRTGEALIGANVSVKGTNLGASTDVERVLLYLTRSAWHA